MFFKRDRKDKERSELAAANRIRSIGLMTTHYDDTDPEEVNRRLRNMSYGSTHNRITAGREEPQFIREDVAAAG